MFICQNNIQLLIKAHVQNNRFKFNKSQNVQLTSSPDMDVLAALNRMSIGQNLLDVTTVDTHLVYSQQVYLKYNMTSN